MEEGNKIVRTLQEKFQPDLLQEKKEIRVTKEKQSNNNRKIERMCVCVCARAHALNTVGLLWEKEYKHRLTWCISF